MFEHVRLYTKNTKGSFRSISLCKLINTVFAWLRALRTILSFKIMTSVTPVYHILISLNIRNIVSGKFNVIDLQTMIATNHIRLAYCFVSDSSYDLTYVLNCAYYLRFTLLMCLTVRIICGLWPYLCAKLCVLFAVYLQIHVMTLLMCLTVRIICGLPPPK